MTPRLKPALSLPKGFLALALGLLAAAPLRAAVQAVAVVVEQPAKFSRDGIKYKPLKQGAELRSGDVLRTGETGRVVLKFVDGSQAAVAPNTDVSLRRLTPKQDPIKTTLSLLKGSLRALVRKLGSRSSFEVETYNTVVAVKGTDLEVSVVVDKDGKRKTVAACFETHGQGLQVSGLDRKDVVNVGAGQQTSNQGEQPQRAAALRAQDMQKALEKYRQLTLALSTPAATPALTAEPGGTPGTTPVVTAEATAAATPVVTPDAQAQAAEQQAQADFDAAARRAEAALATYLEASDSGDLDAMANSQQQLEGLREAAESFEATLERQERQLEERLQELREQQQPQEGSEGGAPAGNAPEQQALQAQLDELQALQDTMKELALQSQLQAQADAAQGNLLMDKDGFRVQLSQAVLRPAGNVIQKVAVSKRSNGPNSGRTEFQHLVTFNKDLPADWVGVYERGLNDPANLVAAGGSPDYWRTQDVVKSFSPSGDCVCLHTDLYTPTDSFSAGVYKQARDEYFQAVSSFGGIAQGLQKFDPLGNVLLGLSDNIQVTAMDTGSGLRLTYNNLGNAGGFLGPTGYTGTIFQVDVSLPGASSALNAASFGSSLYAIANADLSGLTGSTSFELTFSSPAYPGRQVSPLLDRNAFRDAFREGWR